MDPTLLDALRRCGLELNSHTRESRLDADLFAAFDAIGRSGCIAIIKVDGARPAPNVYSVMLSGGSLGQEYFRKDGSELRTLVLEALYFYLRHTISTHSDH